MHTAWLLPLLSTSVHAFYPVHSRKPSDDTSQAKRFFPIAPENADVQESGTFVLDIKKVAKPSKRSNNFPVVLANSPDLPNGMAINEDGHDLSYFATMKFGSKKTPMYMLVDTGSANTWVMGTECSSTSCQAHNLFGPPDSSTLNVTKDPWSVVYGTGTVEGVVASDTVSFANYSVELGFGLATVASSDFSSYPMDGILGLGRPTANILGTPTLMEVLDSKNELRSNIVGIHLQRTADGSRDGQVTFGGVDQSKFSGDISYTKADSTQTDWEIPVGGCSVNGVSTKLTGKLALMDTGTSYILMPPTDAAAIMSLIPGAVANGEYWNIPCTATSVVEFTFSGVTYSVGPEDYLGQANGSMCASGIIGHQPYGPDQWILGDVFLKNVYTVFDYDKERVGFGTKNGAASTTSLGAPVATSTKASSSKATAKTTAPSTSSSSSSSRPSSSTSAAAAAATTTIDASPLGGTNSGATASPSITLGVAIGLAFVVGLLI